MHAVEPANDFCSSLDCFTADGLGQTNDSSEIVPHIYSIEILVLRCCFLAVFTFNEPQCPNQHLAYFVKLKPEPFLFTISLYFFAISCECCSPQAEKGPLLRSLS
jgi:hypothetical protein